MAAPRTATGTVLCIGLDPFLLRMVRTCRPDAELLVAHDAASVLQQLSRGPDVIVQAAEAPGARVADIDLEAKTVTIANPALGSDTQISGNGQVLVRPVAPQQLRLAMDRAVGRSGRLRDRVRTALGDVEWAPETGFALARSLLVVFVVMMSLARLSWPRQGPEPAQWAALVVLLAQGGWRIRRGGLEELPLLSDLVAAVAAGLALGLHPSPALALVVLVAAEVAFLPSSSATVGVLAAAAGVTVVSSVGDVSAFVSVASLLLVISAHLLGLGLVEARADGARTRQQRALRDVHAALVDLHRHAQLNVDHLHATSLHRELAAATQWEFGSDRAALVCGPIESWGQPLTSGFVHASDHDPSEVAAVIRVLRHPVVVEGGALVDLAGGGRCVLAAPLRLEGMLLGAIVLAWDEPLTGRRRRTHLTRLRQAAQDAALALDSAALFAAVDELSVTGERQRLARDLHDGIVQSFVHVGLELDRMADRLADVDLPSALAVLRLRDVVNETVLDSRRVITRLRSRHLERGLRQAIESFLREARRRDDARATLRWEFVGEPSTEVATELFPVVQEAVANARQHAGASTIEVVVSRTGDAIEVVIQDDGRGISPLAPSSALRGHGLPAMHDRIRLLGGQLEIEPRPTGGTVVRALVGGAFPAEAGPRVIDDEQAPPDGHTSRLAALE